MSDERPKTARPQFDVHRLHEDFRRNQVDFLRTELQTSFTLASVAASSMQRREPEHAGRALSEAEKGYATLIRFTTDPKHLKHISGHHLAEVRAGIQQLRTRLDQLTALQK